MRTRIKGICISAVLIFNLTVLSGCGEADPPSGVVAGPEAATSEVRTDGYAPMLVLPMNLPDDPSAQMIAMMLENSVAPAASDVNMPAYPGARVMSTMGPMEMTANDEKMTSLPSMSMLSADETADIVAFYQEHLGGWRYQEFSGAHSFWNGDEDSNPLDITGRFSLVVVLPVTETDTARAMWPEMRTRIDLRYEPPAP